MVFKILYNAVILLLCSDTCGGSGLALPADYLCRGGSG